MKKKLKSICIIPARSGSKRIRNKNIKIFCKKPIISWSIKAAIKSQCFDKIIVSTDSTKISKIAKKYKALVPFLRPKKLSGDHVATLPVINHAIKEMIKIGYKADVVCCLYPCAPLTNYKNIIKAFKLLKKYKNKFIFPVIPYSHPIQRSMFLDKKKDLHMFYPKNKNRRSQDLKKAFHDAAQFYLGKTNNFLNKITIMSKNSKPMILSRTEAIDIDTEDDWKIAELLFKYKK